MQIRARAKIYRHNGLFAVLALLLASLAYYVLTMNTSAAESPSWGAGAPVLIDEITYHPVGQGRNYSLKNCTPQDIWVVGMEVSQQKCVADNGKLSIDSEFKYIKVGLDSNYYRLNGMGTGSRPVNIYSPVSDTYIVRDGFGWAGHSGYLSINSGVMDSIIGELNHAGQREYRYSHTPDFVLSDGHGPLQIGKGGDISKNGRWMVAELYNKGLVRIDLQNGYKTELFSNLAFSYDSGIYPWMQTAISDDGQYVALSDRWIPPLVYEINDSCTKPVSINEPVSIEGYESCPMTSLHGIASPIMPSMHPFALEFGDSNYDLHLHTDYGESGNCSNVNYSCATWRTIRASGYSPPRNPELRYLALGDSYSSGEGDTERSPSGNKYYRYKTDEDGDRSSPREKCHLSTRSYPYILAKGMDLTLNGSKQWNSVACSGAQILDVARIGEKAKNSDMYMGQDDRLDGYNASWLKTEALNVFIPGRQQQIEFVKQYKPKVITLTMGGNDIGFGEKLYGCATPLTLAPTCRYATPEGRPSLASQISGQYSNLKSLYEELYRASGGQAKIYVLGYPQFISNEEVFFCSGIAALNHDERLMIYNSVTYLNNVIEAAASAAGVEYVDIEGSLKGHRLCDPGEEYVTRIVGVPVSARNVVQESFHPNAKGHFEIAMTVWAKTSGESLLEHSFCEGGRNNCPHESITELNIGVPEYFREIPKKNSIYKKVTSAFARKGSPIRIMTGSYVFNSLSLVSVTMFSEPTHLGDFSASMDGSLEEDVVLPDSIPAGYHTLVLSGETYSGEPIELEQVVLVGGVDPGDIDEDGTPDDQQACGPFLIGSGIDEDRDGIDDACDPVIKLATVIDGSRDSADGLESLASPKGILSEAAHSGVNLGERPRNEQSQAFGNYLSLVRSDAKPNATQMEYNATRGNRLWWVLFWAVLVTVGASVYQNNTKDE